MIDLSRGIMSFIYHLIVWYLLFLLVQNSNLMMDNVANSLLILLLLSTIGKSFLDGLRQ